MKYKYISFFFFFTFLQSPAVSFGQPPPPCGSPPCPGGAGGEAPLPGPAVGGPGPGRAGAGQGWLARAEGRLGLVTLGASSDTCWGWSLQGHFPLSVSFAWHCILCGCTHTHTCEHTCTICTLLWIKASVKLIDSKYCLLFFSFFFFLLKTTLNGIGV